MEIMLSHLGVGMAYIVSMGWILFMQKKGLWQQLIHAAAGCEKLFFTLGGLVLMMNLHIFPFMLTIYDYFLNRSLCILCHAKGRIIYKKFFRM
jgi:ABC-type Fe3+ transport system permease subunit